MAVQSRNIKLLQAQNITAARVDHLPIIALYLRQLGLVEIINKLVPVNMDVEPGIIVLGAVLDTLSGRSPLYHLEKAFEEYDRELLFGQDIPPGYFNDDNVGRVLDALFAVGTQKIFSALSVSVLQSFSLSTKHVHFDTTSVRLFGDYRNADGDAPFKITNGYSKDKRPDLKQFVLSLLCVGGDVPIVGKIEDGNASDKKINHSVLSDVSQHMAQHGIANDAFIYVADSAMVTEENLVQISDSPENLFITRLPANYKECARAIQSAVGANQWVEIGAIARTPATKNRPNASYRAHETTVTLYEKSYRAIVVHSSAHDKRRHKRLERELTASLKEARAMAAPLKKRLYSCRADAEQAAQELVARTTQFHQLDIEIIERPRYAPGRPAHGAERIPVAIQYELSATIIKREDVITRHQELAGCFVLLSNVPADWDDGYSAEKILRTYKEQYGIENNFSFLKDDQIVNAIFLKRPERIEALGLILLIALLVWRLMEHTMRTELEATDTDLPGWDNKPTRRPTSYMLTWKFRGIIVLRIGEERRLAQPLSATQEAFLKALRVPVSCFTQAAPWV
jgi:transposase